MTNETARLGRAYTRLTNEAGVSWLPKVHHYHGFPTEIDESESRKLLPVAEVVLIVDQPESGGAFVYRLRRTGEEVGETWHQTLMDAYNQAEYEFGDRLGRWIEIPSSAEDPLEYVRKGLQSEAE